MLYLVVFLTLLSLSGRSKRVKDGSEGVPDQETGVKDTLNPAQRATFVTFVHNRTFVTFARN